MDNTATYKSSNPISLGSFLLIVFYTVGTIGIGLFNSPQFILLTPLNLLISITIVLAYHTNWSILFIGYLIFCFLVGFGVEVIGTNTGQLFGAYQYGEALGWKLWNTPIVMGINWVMLVYCSGTVINGLIPSASFFIKAAVSASVMVLLDFFIEPVAIHCDFWKWEAVNVPILNYLMWWLISFLLLLLFHFLAPKTENKVARTLLLLQFAFFIILNLIL